MPRGGGQPGAGDVPPSQPGQPQQELPELADQQQHASSRGHEQGDRADELPPGPEAEAGSPQDGRSAEGSRPSSAATQSAPRTPVEPHTERVLRDGTEASMPSQLLAWTAARGAGAWSTAAARALHLLPCKSLTHSLLLSRLLCLRP